MSVETRSIPNVVVVGGGVAGLATAYLLREIGRESGRDVRVTVLETAGIVGGSTRTEHKDGFTCEWGPNGFLDNEPATLDLVERLGLTSHLVRANENASHRFIYYGGKMRELPTDPRSFLTSDIVTTLAKVRIAAEFFVAAKRNGREETVYSFGQRRLGKAFADYLLDPMVSGIFAGDTKELSLPAVFPKMVSMEREYGGLFRAMIAKQKEAKRTGVKSGGPAGANAVLSTFENGMGELTSTLANRLNGSVRTSTPVAGIGHGVHGWNVRTNGCAIDTDAVVMACPSYAAAELIDSLAPDVATSLQEIKFSPVDVVCHGYDQRDIANSLHGFGVLVPRSEGVRSLGSLWCDSIFPGQAPAGQHLLRTMIGGAHDLSVTALSTDEIEEIAYRDNMRLVGLKRRPKFRRVFRHEKGIAQYTIGHLDRVAASEQLENEMPGLFFTGASYRGVSVNGCAKDAFRVARRFWDQWRTNHE